MTHGEKDRLESEDGVVLRNEFARVVIRIDRGANGPRLHIRTIGSESEIFLDPLELAGLSLARHAALAELIMPDHLSVESDEWALFPH